MSKRAKDLDPTAVKTDKYILLDGDLQAEAEKFPANSLLTDEDIPRGSASLSVGTQEVLFTDIATTSYLVFACVYDSEGTVGYSITSKQTDRFSVTVAYPATIDFLILKT